MALNTWEFSALLGLGSLVTGIVGALTGLGGGFIVVPLLTLGFGVDIRYAIGASLICVIATSIGVRPVEHPAIAIQNATQRPPPHAVEHFPDLKCMATHPLSIPRASSPSASACANADRNARR